MAEQDITAAQAVGGEEKEEEGTPMECAVCLQTCVFPVQLPCSHIFCYLCVKGVTLQSKRCAMCRSVIPPDFLVHPHLLPGQNIDKATEASFEDGYQWFYEGRNGWWQYDERTSAEIESHHKNGEPRCELLIAGFLYIIDFGLELQYRRNDPRRRRRIKRDLATGPRKGVAGIRLQSDDSAGTTADNNTIAVGSTDDNNVSIASGITADNSIISGGTTADNITIAGGALVTNSTTVGGNARVNSRADRPTTSRHSRRLGASDDHHSHAVIVGHARSDSEEEEEEEESNEELDDDIINQLNSLALPRSNHHGE